MANGPAPLVAVVVPVYNTAAYLPACLNSILAQTWTDWQCTVVDNQSKDGSLAIAEEYARRDPRIRVVAADQFRGQAANFNYALGLAGYESRYVKMVLSDDTIFPRCLEAMVQVGEQNPGAGLIGGYMIAGAVVVCQGLLRYPEQCVAGRAVARLRFMEGTQVLGTQTSVLYRSAAIRDLAPVFDETSLSIDTDTGYRIMRSWDFAFAHEILTFCRTDNESITSSILRFNPYPLLNLILLRQHGPAFLSADEMQSCWHRSMQEYERFLGEAVLQRRPEEFWQFHTGGLERLGITLSAARRARLGLRALVDLAGNPKRTLERFGVL